MKENIKIDMMLIILIFMYIFSLKFISIIDSSIVVGIILFLVFLVNSKYRKNVMQTIFNKNHNIIYGLIILLLLWSLFVVFYLRTYDVSYLKTLFHFLISLTIGSVLCCYCKSKGKGAKILNYIIIAFLAQSILQWIFFLFPSFSSIFNAFRSEQMVAMQQAYLGIKGISLSESGFFSLSSGYALVIGLYYSKYNTIFKKSSYKFLGFLILLSGAFFAGRTGFVGLIMVPFVVYRKGLFKEIKTNFVQYLKYVMLGITACTVFIFFTCQIDKFQKMYNYSFEMFVNAINGKGLQTSSTNTLLGMFKVDFSETNLLIGDGKYTVKNNGITSYYKNTDVGYYRRVLYFGLIGYTLCLLLQYYIIEDVNKYDKKLASIIFAFLLLLELKGEIIGINILVNSILILFSNSYENGETNE